MKNECTHEEWNRGHGIVLDECALSYKCRSPEDALYTALEHIEAVKQELIDKLELLTGELYE